MADLSFEQIANLGKASVAEQFQFVGENKYPLFNWLFGKKKRKLNRYGYEMPLITQRPGGHNFYAPSASDFRAPIPMDSDKMRVYPVWYQIGQTFEGDILRGLRQGNENFMFSYTNNIKLLTDTAKKRLNQTFHEDGTGALAVCTSVLTGTGAGQTLNVQTLASAGAGAAETKGGVRLERNGVYAIINASTAAIKAIFTVTTPGKTSLTVNVTTHSANTASGDPIVDLGASNSLSAYKKAPQGLRSLCAASGVLQNINRADLTEYKTPRVNGNDLPITPYTFATAKAYVNIAANDMNEAENRVVVMPIGQEYSLRIQQFGLRRYDGNENVKGVAKKYIDDDGDTILFDADGAEDRIYILDGNSFYLGEEKMFGLYNEDGNEIRMVAGTNGVGKDNFYLAVGWGGNFIKDVSNSRIQCDVYIDRLAQTDLPQQTSF